MKFLQFLYIYMWAWIWKRLDMVKLSVLDFANLFNNIHLPTAMAPWQSGLLYGSAKPWFIGSNPIGALECVSVLWTKSTS